MCSAERPLAASPRTSPRLPATSTLPLSCLGLLLSSLHHAQATGVPNPVDHLPPEAIDAATEAGGAPAAAEEKKGRFSFLTAPFSKKS